MATGFICKDKIPVIRPEDSCAKAIFKLFGTLLSERVHDEVCRFDSAYAIGFAADEAILAILLMLLLKLLVNRQHAGIEINTVPCEPKNFALTQTGEEVCFIVV